MQYRTLGKDLTVSAVGLGCMGMSHAYGAPADKKEMTELLARAVDMGCTFYAIQNFRKRLNRQCRRPCGFQPAG